MVQDEPVCLGRSMKSMKCVVWRAELSVLDYLCLVINDPQPIGRYPQHSPDCFLPCLQAVREGEEERIAQNKIVA